MASSNQKTERLQVMLALKTHAFLDALASKGTHGTSPTDVARTLIEQGIRRAIREKFLDETVVSKISRAGESP